MKAAVIFAAVIAGSLYFAGCSHRNQSSHGDEYEPQVGDVVFQSLPHNPLIDAIEGSTGSPFSHCGILRRSGTDWLVIEAIGPVKETPLASWIAQSRDRRYSVFRLRQPFRSSIPEMIRAAENYEGLPYDIHYDLDDSAIYCSELIYKAFRKATGKELGQLQTLGELHWKPHETVIREIEDGKLPLERKMITPRGLSEAPQLEKVFESDR
jgi:hypothetical protein